MDRLNTLSYDTNDQYDAHIPTADLSSVTAKHRAKSTSFSAPVTTSSNNLLRSLPTELFKKIQPNLRSVYLSEEQFLYMQDDKLDYVYFPETAVVSEFRTLDDGRMVEVTLTGHEGAVGLMALFCKSRVANCTQISQAGSAVRIESSVLEKMLRLHPEMMALLSQEFDHYIRQISQRSICNMYHSVKERFCTWLLLVQDRCGKKTLKLTHEQIARILGVYRPSITCIALEMRKKGLITYSRGGLSISDRDKVEQSACGCYSELASA